jgi:hypothetical protein
MGATSQTTGEQTVKVSKSKLIRQFIKSNKKATANEVVAGLAATGHSVSVALVNNVRFQLKHGGNKASGNTPTINQIDNLIAVRNFANTIGGYDALAEYINQLRQLTA